MSKRDDGALPLQAWNKRDVATLVARVLLQRQVHKLARHASSAGTQMRSLEPRLPAPPIRRSFNVASTYPVGLSAVKGEQHGFVTGWNSISSTRVPSGS